MTKKNRLLYQQDGHIIEPENDPIIIKEKNIQRRMAAEAMINPHDEVEVEDEWDLDEFVDDVGDEDEQKMSQWNGFFVKILNNLEFADTEKQLIEHSQGKNQFILQGDNLAGLIFKDDPEFIYRMYIIYKFNKASETEREQMIQDNILERSDLIKSHELNVLITKIENGEIYGGISEYSYSQLEYAHMQPESNVNRIILEMFDNYKDILKKRKDLICLNRWIEFYKKILINEEINFVDKFYIERTKGIDVFEINDTEYKDDPKYIYGMYIVYKFNKNCVDEFTEETIKETNNIVKELIDLEFFSETQDLEYLKNNIEGLLGNISRFSLRELQKDERLEKGKHRSLRQKISENYIRNITNRVTYIKKRAEEKLKEYDDIKKNLSELSLQPTSGDSEKEKTDGKQIKKSSKKSSKSSKKKSKKMPKKRSAKRSQKRSTKRSKKRSVKKRSERSNKKFLH